MITKQDVHAYLNRLELDREPASAEGLFRLHRAHLERVPYETTWIHMGQQRSVDREASLRDIAHRQRGGYCFQLNGALSLLLESLGYDVSLHVGGVHGPDGPAVEAMENHLVLLVHGLASENNPDGTWYVDAGLGDALHEPLPLVAGRYQQGPFEFELETTDSPIADWRFRHHALGSFSGMAFRARAATMDEFASRNTYLSTSPESGFVKILTVQRRDAGGVDILRGQMLSRVEATVSSERELTTKAEWFEVLADVFSLPLDDITSDDADRLWQRVHTAHEAWKRDSAPD